jgi:hypothetical protein
MTCTHAIKVTIYNCRILAARSTICAGDDFDVMVAGHDLTGPLLDLVTAVLAEGKAP